MKRVWSVVVTVFALALLSAAPLQAADLPDFRQIVRQNSGAVVKILSTQRAQQRAGGTPQDIDPRQLEQLPDIFRHLLEQRGQREPRERQAMGSGFITSQDGYILTNHHVVDGADSVTVRLNDRREFEAKVIGSDKRSDIALLKIDATGLQTVTLGDSEALEVGEWVLAIGSPFGLDYSVSAGIVSARGRSLPTETGDNYVPFIQTDVAINPGNSGGPLFNLKGEVIGINSQIYTRSGGSIGLSFAIPIEVARDVAQQLRETGAVVRGWLGVGIQDVDRNLAESFGLDRPMGALISQLEPGGPAEKAGIKVGDVIVELDGREVGESADLPHAVGLIKPGTRVAVKLFREGKPRSLDVEVGKLAGDEPQDVAAAGGAGDRIGLEVEDLSDQQKARMRLASGVVVRSVLPGKAAARAGLMPGDIIAQVGNEPVRSTADFASIVDALPANIHVPLRLIRRGQAGFIALRIEE
jgi:serine protease Do